MLTFLNMPCCTLTANLWDIFWCCDIAGRMASTANQSSSVSQCTKTSTWPHVTMCSCVRVCVCVFLCACPESPEFQFVNFSLIAWVSSTPFAPYLFQFLFCWRYNGFWWPAHSAMAQSNVCCDCMKLTFFFSDLYWITPIMKKTSVFLWAVRSVVPWCQHGSQMLVSRSGDRVVCWGRGLSTTHVRHAYRRSCRSPLICW